MTDFKYLLLQIRNPDDPMRAQEVECFARELHCRQDQITTFDLIKGQPTAAQLDTFDIVLVGGSGDYSVVKGGTWLGGALETCSWLYEQSKPTFASCWGFQAFARALGGRVVTDLKRAELGTTELRLTDAGKSDPVFAPLGSPFMAQMGHQDIVDSLPEGAILLASTDKVENEAFTFSGKPIYGTQFHPEFRLKDFLERVRAYPEYVEKITGLSIDEFASQCQPTPATGSIIKRFVESIG